MIDIIKKHIDKYDVISFDIFDTVITRCFLQPDDVFRYIESLEGSEGFTDARKKAEIDAFSTGLEKFEVTLDDIYKCIPKIYHSLKSVELDVEKKCISANPTGYELYNYVISKGKKVIFVSDSYLSFEFLKDILASLGFDDYDKLFVSSEYNKTKRSGNLFDEIGKYFKLDSILHIGDNFHSDFISPQENKINCLSLNEREYDCCFSNYKNRVGDYLKSIDNQLLRSKISILAKMDLLNFRYNDNQSFWKNIGFCYAGTMVFSFIKWIETIASENKISCILFVARDGYILNEFFNRTNKKINSKYLYLNRKIIENISYDDEKKSEYIDCIKTVTNSEKVMVVDVGTNNFSMQKFLLNNGIDCVGAYWCTGKNTSNLNYYKFFDLERLSRYDEFFGSSLIEFFMTSPEPPIIDIKIENKEIYPVYKHNVSPYERYRICVLEEMISGINDYINYYYKYLDKLEPNFDSKDIIEWNAIWLRAPSIEEINEFGKIFHSSDGDHVEYLPQFEFLGKSNQLNNTISLMDYLMSLKMRLKKWL